MVQMTPFRLILKLSWDNEKPASCDFALGKRKKSAVAISGKKGSLRIVFLPLLPFEVPECGDCAVRVIILPQKPVLGQQYGTFWL
jgi:hypothetical protein